MRNLSTNTLGFLALCLLTICAIPMRGDAAEERKPSPTVIGGTPWTPRPAQDGPKVTYGTDDRIDVYEETDPERLTWAASTCGLISAQYYLENADGTYSILPRSNDFCDEEPFSSQPTAAFCTGFMVGEDLIATAGHCYNTGNLGGTRFVFGYVMEDVNTPALSVGEDQVYQGIEVVGRANAGGEDYAIIRVDRPIVAPGAVPFEIRREGVVAVGAPVGVIGHPAGLPLKLAFGDTTAVRANDHPSFFVANLDTYGGNSGSPVIDPLTGIVEGILVRGDTDFVTVGNCTVSNVVPDDGGRGEDVSKTTTFKEFVPRLISSDGTLHLGQARYGCDGELLISLNDADLAGLPTAAVEVTTSGGDSEVVVLTALPEAAQFSGTLSLQAGEIVADNATLEVVEGDLVTVRYFDASHTPEAPDYVVVETLVDCTPPVVTNVTIAQIGAQFASLLFESSEPVSGSVEAGAACGAFEMLSSFSSGTTHNVPLQGLLPLNEYFVVIRVMDEAGNWVVVNNEGLCFQFTTAETTAYYTEIFATTPSDLAQSSVLFSPVDGDDGYTVCNEALTALPVPGTDAILLTLQDDGFTEVRLTAGATFPFYGTQYERIFVNANGNITFNAGDMTHAPTAEAHFSVARVSPYFSDLNPAAFGTVWHRQLEDRIVVTWEGVPRYSSTDPNTVQVELYFDGAIRFSYLTLAGQPSLVGLSAGFGAASDFVSMDLNAQAACGTSTGRYHSADTDRNHVISLRETLRVIQFMNMGGYHCDLSGQGRFSPGPGAKNCAPHDSDYSPQDWAVGLSEINRLIQFYNAGGYGHNPASGTEDGFFPILAR